ncbi:hypothetical protein [Deinococcus sonorensis]|uniref:RES domain-containing protein n=1 Tax=Deinococcus sonorensis TaxID=309891 RepID=A0ABV8YA08_9DEIO
MLPWMLAAPRFEVSMSLDQAFHHALETRDLTLVPPDAPRWVFLQWLADNGWLLHGSPTAGLHELRPRDVEYNQPDEFSNTRGVYAASDGIWAMMYALKSPRVHGQSDMGLRVRLPDGRWSDMHYFLSVAPHEPDTSTGRDLLGPGVVYVVSREGFTPSPPYDHPGLGFVQEAHWVNPGAVIPVLAVPVVPDDFPLPVYVHDADVVMARSSSDPWGFPWLDAPASTRTHEPEANS